LCYTAHSRRLVWLKSQKLANPATRCFQEQGVFGGIILGEDFLEYFHDPSPAMQGFVTSV